VCVIYTSCSLISNDFILLPTTLSSSSNSKTFLQYQKLRLTSPNISQVCSSTSEHHQHLFSQYLLHVVMFFKIKFVQPIQYITPKQNEIKVYVSMELVSDLGLWVSSEDAPCLIQPGLFPPYLIILNLQGFDIVSHN
jgi:hypothetical protein